MKGGVGWSFLHFLLDNSTQTCQNFVCDKQTIGVGVIPGVRTGLLHYETKSKLKLRGNTKPISEGVLRGKLRTVLVLRTEMWLSIAMGGHKAAWRKQNMIGSTRFESFSHLVWGFDCGHILIGIFQRCCLCITFILLWSNIGQKQFKEGFILISDFYGDRSVWWRFFASQRMSKQRTTRTRGQANSLQNFAPGYQ